MCSEMGSLLSTTIDEPTPQDDQQLQSIALPVEIGLQVASHLSKKDIKNFRAVNKNWD